MYGVSEWLLREPLRFRGGRHRCRSPFRPPPAELDGLIQELAQLAITMLFPLLAADVSWAEPSPLGWGGILCVLSLMLVVRPLGVGVATIGLPFKLEQRLFLGWFAPRGIVTAAVASLFAIRLEQADLGAGRLQGLVFRPSR